MPDCCGDFVYDATKDTADYLCCVEIMLNQVINNLIKLGGYTADQARDLVTRQVNHVAFNIKYPTTLLENGKFTDSTNIGTPWDAWPPLESLGSSKERYTRSSLYRKLYELKMGKTEKVAKKAPVVAETTVPTVPTKPSMLTPQDVAWWVGRTFYKRIKGPRVYYKAITVDLSTGVVTLTKQLKVPVEVRLTVEELLQEVWHNIT